MSYVYVVLRSRTSKKMGKMGQKMGQGLGIVRIVRMGQKTGKMGRRRVGRVRWV